jgi:hypothetical protein
MSTVRLLRARPPYCLRHSRNTSRDVYHAAILFAASHSSVAWLPSNRRKQTSYCLQHARHNIIIIIIIILTLLMIYENDSNTKVQQTVDDMLKSTGTR